MKSFVKYSILLLISLSSSTLFADIKLVKKDDFNVYLGVDAALNGVVDYREVAAGFVVDAAKISIRSTYKKKYKLFISVDPSKPNSSSKASYNEPLDKLYLQVKVNDNFRVRVGQFKVPFGYEQFQGLEERPLITHRKSTKRICPDLDRGVMLYGKKISGWFSYYTGFFNGTSVEQSLNSVTLLTPVKFQVNKKFDRTKLKVGINSYIRANYAYNEYLKYRWGNGFYSEVTVKTSKGNRVKFLGEFLEKLDFRDLESSEKDWEVGGFLVSSYRVKNIEPSLFAELYNKDISQENLSDRALVGGGFNIHFFEDHLRLTAQLEYAYPLYHEDDNITGILSFRGFL
jgi:hypothetical protein